MYLETTCWSQKGRALTIARAQNLHKDMHQGTAMILRGEFERFRSLAEPRPSNERVLALQPNSFCDDVDQYYDQPSA